MCEKKKKLFSKADFGTNLQALNIGISYVLNPEWTVDNRFFFSNLFSCISFLIYILFSRKKVFIWILNICCILCNFSRKKCTKGIIGKLAATIFNLLHETIYHCVLCCSYYREPQWFFVTMRKTECKYLRIFPRYVRTISVNIIHKTVKCATNWKLTRMTDVR